MEVFSADQGTAFGTWSDPVSQFMYGDTFDIVQNTCPLTGHIGDYGGANGLLRQYMPDAQITTIDVDPTKEPDIIDDIVGHRGRYDTGFARYVLHYLTDQQAMAFLDNANVDRMVVVQFCNADLRAKYGDSANEFKYFRTVSQTSALMPPGTKLLYEEDYEVTPEFYRNRLGLEVAKGHAETLCIYEVVR